MLDTRLEFLKSQYSPAVNAIGKTALRRHCSIYDVYCQMLSRLEYLQAVQSYFRENEDISKVLHSDEFDRNKMLSEHLRYVRSCLSRLDINNTIDTLVECDYSLVGEFDFVPSNSFNKNDLRDWRKYVKEFPRFVLDAYFYDVQFKYQAQDVFINNLVSRVTAMSRRSNYRQRLINQIHDSHDDGWYFVFNTLSLDPDRLTEFYSKNTSIRDYFRNIGRELNAIMGRKKSASFSDIFKYFLIPEYGEKHGRLHFHCLMMFKDFPDFVNDPTLAHRGSRYHREINWLKPFWKFGTTSPLTVRYQSDNYTTVKRWNIPLDKKSGKAMELKPVDAVVNYIVKYVSKTVGIQQQEDLKKLWVQNLVKRQIYRPNNFRVRMTRGFGLFRTEKLQPLSNQALIELTNLHWTTSNVSALLKSSARRELSRRLGALTLRDITRMLVSTQNLFLTLQILTSKRLTFSQLNSIDFPQPKLINMDISDEVKQFLKLNNLARDSKSRFASTLAPK